MAPSRFLYRLYTDRVWWGLWHQAGSYTDCTPAGSGGDCGTKPVPIQIVHRQGLVETVAPSRFLYRLYTGRVWWGLWHQAGSYTDCTPAGSGGDCDTKPVPIQIVHRQGLVETVAPSRFLYRLYTDRVWWRLWHQAGSYTDCTLTGSGGDCGTKPVPIQIVHRQGLVETVAPSRFLYRLYTDRVWWGLWHQAGSYTDCTLTGSGGDCGTKPVPIQIVH